MTEEIIIDGGRMAGITTLKNEIIRLEQENKWQRNEEKYLKECCIKAGKELEKNSFTWDGKEKNLVVQALELNKRYEILKQENKDLKKQIESQKGLITEGGKQQYQYLQRIDKLEQENKELRREIAELRKDCNHCNFHIYRSALEEINRVVKLAHKVEDYLLGQDYTDLVDRIEKKINEVLQ